MPSLNDMIRFAKENNIDFNENVIARYESDGNEENEEQHYFGSDTCGNFILKVWQEERKSPLQLLLELENVYS